MAFEDPDFPAEQSSIGSVLGRDQDVVWLRPKEVALRKGSERKQVSLFGVSISPQDVLEGQLDDCYLVSALSLLATTPAAVQRLFEFHDVEEGKVVVNFWRRGQRESIVVDDRVPCNATTGKPLFAHCRDPSGYWVQLVEKAFAKVHGSYITLGGGNTAGLHLASWRPHGV